ncbi:MAG: hypothetical protein ACLP7Q_19790 [Isosphaeraceae bacterium]
MRPLFRSQCPSRRFCQPGVEGLETRALLSTVAPNGPLAHAPAAPVQYVSPQALSTSIAPANPTVIQQLVQMLYKPVTTTFPIEIGNQVFPPGTYQVPQPTAAEIKRETFVERLIGRYVIGPPRFSNQAATIHIYSSGANAMSNQFLHSRSQIILFTPADPTAQPTTNDPVAGQVTGLTSAFPLSFLNSSSYVIWDVTNLPGVASNDPSALDHGLPSRLAVTYDPVGGGVYAAPQFTSTPAVQTNAITGQSFPLLKGTGGAVNFQNGIGELDIKYVPDVHPKAGTRGSGTAIVTITALFNTTGATSAIAQPIN